MERPAAAADLERRKQVKLRLRGDLDIAPQRYEGRTYYVVKDPVSLRYYRFKEAEHFLLQFLDGSHTLDDAQKEYEDRYRPERLTLEDLEGFARQLITAGLAVNESPQAGKQLFERRKKRLRSEWMQVLTNVLYIKLPIYDPDRLLTYMLRYLYWIFTPWFLAVSVAFMSAAILLVATHFEMFRDKLPAYHEFFSFKTAIYLWIALGVVKVIHEFGHGLSCKAFGGEVHEMGALLLVFSPALYCNVSDAWTLPDKWKRIIISAAGIYVELIIAACATFVWWNTPSQPFINNLSLSLMVVCSVSTVVFNANPLMRYDGYYVLADWLEIPNLRDRANRFLTNLVLEHCLGVETQPEPYMELERRILFFIFAVVSYVYRWVVTYFILWFLYNFLKPYKLGVVSGLLAWAAVGSMVGWPLYRLGKNLYRRGRLPDMKPFRVAVSVGVLALLLLAFLTIPVPVARIRQAAVVQVQPDAIEKIFIVEPAILEELDVRDGQHIQEGEVLARFSSLDLDNKLKEATTELSIRVDQISVFTAQLNAASDPTSSDRIRSTLTETKGEKNKYQSLVEYFEKKKQALVVKAPRTGVVMSPPHVDDVGKMYEKDLATPFCSVGDPQQLRAVVPITPAEYRLLKEDKDDLAAGLQLPVTIRVQGRGKHTWKGIVAQLPEAEAKEIPFALSLRGGGPVAVKQTARQNVQVPQNQQYLVAVNFLEPDAAIAPGTMAQVKIHLQWRTCAWWLWWTISSTFDLGLM